MNRIPLLLDSNKGIPASKPSCLPICVKALCLSTGLPLALLKLPVRSLSGKEHCLICYVDLPRCPTFLTDGLPKDVLSVSRKDPAKTRIGGSAQWSILDTVPNSKKWKKLLDLILVTYEPRMNKEKKKGDQDGHTHFRYAVTCSGQWEISLIVACLDSRLLVRQAVNVLC